MCNTDIAKKNGTTPLYIAAKHGHTVIVSQLITAMVDGSTPLWVTAREGHDAIVSHLITEHCNVDIAKMDGTT